MDWEKAALSTQRWMAQDTNFETLCRLTLDRLGNLLHHLQRERGCSSLYLSSHGHIFSERLREQHKLTDDEISNLSDHVSQARQEPTFDQTVFPKVATMFTRLESLKGEREHIIDLSLQPNQAINRYTFQFTIPILDLMVETAQSLNLTDSRRVSAYSRFLQWKERIGRERAIGIRGFASRAFRNPEFSDRMLSLMAEQNACLQTFLLAADDVQKAILDRVLESEDFKALEAIHNLIESHKDPSELDHISGQDWFELLTRMSDLLHEAEKDILANMFKDDQREDLGPEEMGDARPSHAEAYSSFVSSLSMFSHLPEVEMKALLAQAQIRQCDKGQLLFVQGEPAARLYVVVRGWVKLFNGTEAGQETVLQMLSAGDTMLEGAVILNMPAPMSGQAVEETTLISFPAPIIRQHVQKNSRFALNMLSNMSLRSQRLIHQIEQARLKSAKERLGWFLLQAMLDSGTEDSVIELPYDKALVASYLDMRPETLSRTLKKFKSEGFAIDQDAIRLPDQNALCSFCDANLASSCKRAFTDECPHKDEFDIAAIAT